MRKTIVICTILCAFLSCASTNKINSTKPDSKADAYHLISFPEGNSLIFFGVASRQIKPELEIEAAREDAAKRVSMYHGLKASVVSVQSIGTNALDYYSDSDFQMEYNTQLDVYKSGLTFDPERDVIRGDTVVFVRFSYPGVFPVSINYTSARESDGSPGWVRRPPLEINGFMVQTGFARRQQRLRDTIAKACEDAIVQLINRFSSTINSTDTSANERSASFVTHQSSGKLSNFMVMETWIDPENLSAWIFTVAKTAN